jgi:hypothetical protein
MTKVGIGGRVTAAVAAAALAIGLLAATAGASANGQTTHQTFDPTGAVFPCLGGDLTVTGGTVSEVDHFTQDAQGVFHYTGTLTVDGVTLQDAGGNAYTLSGSSWFGGKTTDPEGEDLIVGTDTNHFVIHRADGSAYAKVQLVDHVSPNGDSFTFDRGTCEPPSN